MAYTPELSMKSSQTLRRIAWFLNIPMTTALEQIVDVMPAFLDKEKVCEGCRDDSICKECVFSAQKHKARNKEVLCQLRS